PMATAVRQHLAMAARMEITAPTLAATAEMMADLSNQPTPTAETAEVTRKEILVRILLTISYTTLKEVPMVNDRYRLGDVIGTGGMSEVYRATDSLLGRDVAIKMLRPEMARDVNFRERFRKEAQNSGRLNHPNIVAVYDTGEADEDGMAIPYIVMELVHGRTLRDLV